jgi:hypothetical protein
LGVGGGYEKWEAKGKWEKIKIKCIDKVKV